MLKEGWAMSVAGDIWAVPSDAVINAGSVADAGGLEDETTTSSKPPKLSRQHTALFADWAWADEARLQQELVTAIQADELRKPLGCLDLLCGAGC